MLNKVQHSVICVDFLCDLFLTFHTTHCQVTSSVYAVLRPHSFLNLDNFKCNISQLIHVAATAKQGPQSKPGLTTASILTAAGELMYWCFVVKMHQMGVTL